MTCTSILCTVVSLAALVVVEPAAAFVPTIGTCKHLPRTALGLFDGIKERLANRIDPEVLPGVRLPEEEGLLSKVWEVANLNFPSSKAFLKFTVGAWPGVKKVLEEQDNKGSLDVAQDSLKKYGKFDVDIPDSKNYKFYGDPDNRVEELITLVKSNPFVATALTTTRNGFELKSYDPKEKNPSLFLKYMRTLNGKGHKVNFEFNKQMEVKSFTVFDEDGKKQKDADMNEWASSMLFNLGFSASCIHATIHVLHYLLTAAFEDASGDYKGMHKWARWYDKAISIKYLEVHAALINDTPTDGSPDIAVITGSDGFGSSQEIRPMLKDLLDSWGQSPTAKGFFDTMFNLSRKQMEEAGILTEFFKHFDLVEPYAADVTKALREIDSDAFEASEANLKTALKSCGDFKSNIDTFDQWFQLMATTGIVHGGTLSYSRLIGTPDVVRWRNLDGTKWDEGDLNLVQVGLATIVGMDPGRHVMSSEPGKLEDKLQAVLDEYDAKALAIKEEYKAKLLENPDFNNLGFILSDFCPDGFDGKQLTVATYF